MEDLYADWAQPHRRELLRTHSTALEGASRAALAVGDATLALQRAEAAVTADPLREAANLLLVRAYAADGDPAGAVGAYAAFRDRLAGELGLDPSPEAEDLQRRLLRGERLDPIAAPRTRRRAPDTVADVAVGELAFVGREREVDALLAAVSGQPAGAAVVVGASGAGKSRLLAEGARAAGVSVLKTRAFLAERGESWSMARRLVHEAIVASVAEAERLPGRVAAALAEVLPELEQPPPGDPRPLDPESSHRLAMEGAVRLLAAPLAKGGLVVADDLQWADATSLQLLLRLRARAPQVGMVLAYRPEEVHPASLLPAVLRDLAATGTVATLELGPLSTTAITALVTDGTVASIIADHTDRSPMAVAEVVGTLVRTGVLRRGGPGRWAPATADARQHTRQAARAGQRRVILARAGAQPPDSQTVLRVLALLGRETPARLLARAVDMPEPDVLARLDALARAGLVRLGDRGWAPEHDLVADNVVAGLEPTARARLHATMARTLAEDGAEPAELARHHLGARDLDAAASAYARAARTALDRFANTEATQLASAGLEVAPRQTVRADLLEARAEAHAGAGAFAEAAADLREALRNGRRGAERARLLARHARLAAGTEDLVRAGELVQLALAETGDDTRARAVALYAGALVDMNTDRPERARERTREALRLFEELQDAQGIADILDARAMATFLDGPLVEALDLFDRAARLFTDAGDLMRVVTPRSTRGHGLVFAADPTAGLADTEEALDVARSLGYAEGEAYALWHRSEALAALGRGDEALREAETAVAIAQRLGHRSWTVTSHRALGIARQALGDLEGAEQAFAYSLQLAEHWPLFRSWACSRIALVRLARGETDGLDHLVADARAIGPPLAHHEARLAHAELTAARGDHDAAAVAAAALHSARSSGHLASAARLEELSVR